MRYDIAIIGTGPAGVSAAITSAVRGKSIILLGSKNLSDKMTKAERIDNYPGLPSVSGQAMAEAYRKQLEALSVEVTEKRVNAVYAMGKYFALQAGEAVIEATTVILASGIVLGKPLPGEDEFLGRGVSYCATCDGRLYAGRKAAVLGYSEDAADEADFLADVVGDVLYFPLGKTRPKARENLHIIEEKPVGIEGMMKVNTLVTDKQRYDVDVVFILRDAIAPDKMVPGLKTEGPHIAVDLQMTTNLKGLFACGDIAGRPYQYIKAAGQGNVAALSAVAYLAALKKEETHG